MFIFEVLLLCWLIDTVDLTSFAFKLELHNLSYHTVLSLLDLQSTEQVAAFCRSLHDMNPSECVSSSPSPDSPFPPPATPRQLSDADKLRKVICELVETERTYVKVSITHPICKVQMVFVCVCSSCRSICVSVCLGLC